MSEISSLTHAISVDPFSDEQIGHYAFDTDAAQEAALQRAKVGFNQWRQVSLGQRSEYLNALADALQANHEALAVMISREIGKPISQARGEVTKCVALCQWYAEHGPAMLAAEPTQIATARIEYRPLGPILAVMPWNFPLWQVLRGAVPALLAGNTYVLKHAPNVMGSAYLLLDVINQAGLPAGIFEVLNVTPDGVTRAINDPRIAAVTLTGSVRAGMAIGAQAGAALKKCVLELGGSDPFIVLADADLDAAVKAAVIGRYQNTGQVCAAAKRLIVEESIAEAFTAKFVEATRQLKVGNPLEADTYIGPMARSDLRDELDGQVQATLAEGAVLLLGGKKAEGVGNFYEPTVFAGVTPQMTAFKQELFGPVAAIISARDADHAVELANDSEFGLASTIYTANLELAERMTSALDTGAVFINGYCASDPRVAFGGVKKSGFGRELSHFGVREFCNVQTVWLDRN